jgi:glycine/D-amino acid oxidase-like deaminating enzyme
MNSKYVVIGAGIVGASIGYHLARQGAQVTIVDKASSPADGATHNSFGWFSGVGGDWPGGADDLRAFVLDDYRRLEKEVPGLSVRWTGSLVCTDVSVRLNNGMQVVSGQQSIAQNEIAALEPNIKQVPARAVYSPTDGGIDPILATTALLDAAKSHGAVTIFGHGPAIITTTEDHTEGVFVGETFYKADTVIVAAAAGAQQICESLGVSLPMTVSPAFWLKATGPVGLVKTILDTPEFEIRESRDGHYLMTALHHGDGSAAHQKQLAQATIERVNERFGLTDRVQLLDYGICQRPMPANGPIIDYITNDTSVYVAVMHSGVTLAPTVGRLIADELTSGERSDALRRCKFLT